MFLGSENSMVPSERLLRSSVETGNDKFKMAVANPEVLVYQLL
jgi:hypothetical protein